MSVLWVLVPMLAISSEFLDNLRPYQWRVLSQVYGQIPAPREGHSMVTFGRTLLVFGGCDVVMNCYNDLHSFNTEYLLPRTFEWRLLNSTGQIPTPRSGHSALMLNTRMYVFGGTAGSFYYNELFMYDAVTDRWQLLLPSGPLPAGRANHGAVLTRSGNLLITGGITGIFHSDKGFTNDVWEFQVSEGRWNKLKFTGTPPVPREQSSMVRFRGQALLFGGFHEGGVSDEVYALDLTTLEWSLPLDDGRIPESRQGHSAVLIGDYMFVTAGCDYARKTCYSDLYVLDLTTMWWTEILPARGSDAFSGRERSAASAMGQSFFVFGGCQLYTFCLSDLLVINTGVECPNDCWNNGVCRSGLCLCDPGYLGNDCSIRTRCQSNCNYQGFCNSDAQCDCYPGYTGRTCQTWIDCPRNCTSAVNGRCEPNGECRCNDGYFGEDCGVFSLCGLCLHGECGDGACRCEEGWSGTACDQEVVEDAVETAVEEVTEEAATEESATEEAATEEEPAPETPSTGDSAPEEPATTEPATETSVEQTESQVAPSAVSALQLSPENSDLGLLRSFPCPLNCNRHGICRSGVCYCEEGFSGESCGVQVGGNFRLPLLLVVAIILAATCNLHTGLGLAAGALYIRRVQSLQAKPFVSS